MWWKHSFILFACTLAINCCTTGCKNKLTSKINTLVKQTVTLCYITAILERFVSWLNQLYRLWPNLIAMLVPCMIETHTNKTVAICSLCLWMERCCHCLFVFVWFMNPCIIIILYNKCTMHGAMHIILQYACI